ncbi:MAG: EutN/CcmL family microcompartment protein [Christensenellales bacterium]
MQLAKVIGSMVSTRKCERLQGLKLLVAVPIDMDTFEEKGAPFITVDTVGAGEGEIVMWAGGSSSRQTDLTTNKTGRQLHHRHCGFCGYPRRTQIQKRR